MQHIIRKLGDDINNRKRRLEDKEYYEIKRENFIMIQRKFVKKR